MHRDPKLEALRSVPLFDALSRKELAALAKAGDELDIPEGKVLTAEGTAGSEFFVLLRGEARVSHDGQDLGLMGPGDFFGEIALLEDVPRTATVTAATPSRIFVLTRQRFRSHIERQPKTGEKVHQVAVRRLGNR
jgi:CRP/FNR family transcriptional regulator, cyclic AMP receptor protein